MGSYNTRWCEKHGEWEQDVDDPYAECPQCIEEGTSPTQLRYKATLAMEAEIKKLMDDNERLRALVYSYPPTEYAPDGVTWQQEAERLRGLLRWWLTAGGADEDTIREALGDDPA